MSDAVKQVVLAVFLVALLSACGGGGGSSPGSTIISDAGGSGSSGDGMTTGLAEANQFPQVDSVQSSNLDPVDLFGARFAIDGTTFVVSADGEDSGDPNNQLDNTTSSAGAAYVYELINNDWVQTAYLKAPIIGTTSFEQFGFSVSISGNTIAVGVLNYDSPGISAADPGAVFIFDRVNGVWNLSQTLLPATTRLFTNFGIRVVIDGDTLITVGQDREQERRIIVFERVNGIWSETATLLGSAVDTNVINTFGLFLDVSGDTIATQNSTEQAVYVFRKVGDTWVEQQRITSPAGFQIQGDVTVNGDRLLTGSNNNTILSYVRSDDTFSLDQTLTSIFPVPNIFGNFDLATLRGAIDFDGTILSVGIGDAFPTSVNRGFLFQLVNGAFVNVGHVQTMLPNLGAPGFPVDVAVSFPFAIASGTNLTNGTENVSIFDLSSLP